MSETIYRAVGHRALKCKICLLESITRAENQGLNDVLWLLFPPLLVHNELQTLPVLLMDISGWNVISLQLSG